MMSQLNLFLFYFAFSINLSGQPIDNIFFKNIDKKEGLPSNYVTDVIKDNLGFLWVATNDGLCRYDGPNTIKIFKADTILNKDGLRANHIQKIYVDSRDNLWIGTRLGGLTRYHQPSNTWKTFQHSPDIKNSISHNDILSIHEDSQHRLWVGTENGLNLYDYEKEIFTNFLVEENNPYSLKSGAILNIMEDHRGWIWVGTWGGGLHLLLTNTYGKINRGQFRNFKPSADKGAYNVWKIYQDPQKRYWLGTHWGGLFLMQLPKEATNQVNQQEWTPQFYNYNHQEGNEQSIANNAVHDIKQDGRGRLWVATVEGLSYVDESDLPTNDKHNTIPKINFNTLRHNPNKASSIKGNMVSSILEDKQGLMWFSTSKGISQYNWYTSQFNIINLSNKIGNLPNAQSIYLDDYQNIWLSASDQGLILYNLKNNKIDYISKRLPNLLLDNTVFAICHKGEKEFLVGSKLGITLINSQTLKTKYYPTPDWIRKSIPNLLIQKIFVDKSGLIWVGTELGLFTIQSKTGVYSKYTATPNILHSISDNAVNDIFQDSYGTIWVATYKGLNRVRSIEGTSIKFDHFTHNASNPNSIPINQIIALNQLGDRLYLGSMKGLYSYNLTTKKFESYPSPENNFFIVNIQKTNNKQLWMSTTEGILSFNPVNKSFNSFAKEDGVGNGEFRLGAGTQDENGLIYFGSNEGITYFHPDSIVKNEVAPPVYLTNITKSNSRAQEIIEGIYKEDIILNPDDNYLSINFAALNYNRGEKNQYTYQLEGFEENWHRTNFGNPIVYTNLTPQTYQLKIKAANNDGVWNDKGVVLNIIKYPAFWQTWWFKLLVLIGIGLLTGVGVKIYTDNIRNRNRRLQQYNNMLNKEIGERKEVEKTLAEKEQFLRLIMNNIPQFIYWVDKKGNFLGANKALLDFFQLEEGKELIGKRIPQLNIPTSYADSFTKILKNILNTKKTIFNEVYMIPTVGKYSNLWLEQSFIPLMNNNEVIGMLMCGSNISDRVKNEKMAKDYTNQLKSYNKELKRSNKDLEQFAYIASHDLKEPLRIVGNFSGLLARAYKTKLDKDAFQYIDFIEDGVRRMDNLINSLLTYSRVGLKENTFSVINLNQILELEQFDLSQIIKDRNAKVIVHPLPEIYGEKEQIGMVFQNLISNAIKFNKQEQPIITIQLEDNQSEDYWQFSVSDNGIGIDPNYHEQIFGIFRRLHGKKAYAGTGIGLAVCKKIIFRHEGKIWLESIPDKGTTFFFTISKSLIKTNPFQPFIKSVLLQKK